MNELRAVTVLKRTELLLVEKSWKQIATTLSNPDAARCLAEAECLGITDPWLNKALTAVSQSKVEKRPPWTLSTPRFVKTTSPLRIKPKTATPRKMQDAESSTPIPPSMWIHRSTRRSTPKPSKFASSTTVHRDAIAYSPKSETVTTARISTVKSGIASEAVGVVSLSSPRAPLALARSVKCHSQSLSSREQSMTSITQPKTSPQTPRSKSGTESITCTPLRFYSDRLSVAMPLDAMLEHQMMRYPPPDQMPLHALTEGSFPNRPLHRGLSVADRLSKLGRSGSVNVKAGIDRLSEWLVSVDGRESG